MLHCPYRVESENMYASPMDVPQRPLEWNFTHFFDVFDQFCPISALECFFFKIKYPISFERIEYIRSNEGLLLSLRCMEKIVYIFFWLFTNLADFEVFLAGYWWKITFLVFFCSDPILCIKGHRIRYGWAKSEKKVVYCTVHTSNVMGNCSLYIE